MKHLLFSFLIYSGLLLTLSLNNDVQAQTCPGQSFVPYGGGNISWAASESQGKCFDNLVPGQTYCFSYIQPDSDLVEMDININGCSHCPTSMYGDFTGNTDIYKATGASVSTKMFCMNATPNDSTCHIKTYDPSCNVISNGVEIAKCASLQVGKIYTICFTVPASCSSMSICPLLKCRNCYLPTVQASADKPSVCIGACANLTATGNFGKAPYTYAWAPGGGIGSTVSVCPTTTTTYTVTMTDSWGITTTNTVTVGVSPPPAVAVTNDTIVCNGGSITLSATGGVSCAWAPATGLNDVNSCTPVASPTVPTTYTVTVTDANGCTNTGSVKVTIGNSPVVTITSSGSIGCDSNTIYLGLGPQSLVLTANSASNITTYQWFLNGAPVAGGTSKTLTVTQAGLYNVLGADAAGCKSDTSNTISVNVLDIRCGEHNQKIIICHKPDGNMFNEQTLCLSPSGAMAHMKLHHHDCFGACPNPPHPHPHPWIGRRLEDSESTDDFGMIVYPNPFTDETMIDFNLPGSSNVTLYLYDTKGAIVAKLFDGAMEGGDHKLVTLNGSGLSEGVYIATLTSSYGVIHQRITYTK